MTKVRVQKIRDGFCEYDLTTDYDCGPAEVRAILLPLLGRPLPGGDDLAWTSEADDHGPVTYNVVMGERERREAAPPTTCAACGRPNRWYARWCASCGADLPECDDAA